MCHRTHIIWHTANICCMALSVIACITVKPWPLAMAKSLHSGFICAFEKMCAHACKCEKERDRRDEKPWAGWKAQSQPMFPVDGEKKPIMEMLWCGRRWKEPQPGSCCQVIELQPGLLVSHPEGIQHCCFHNCFPVSLALRFIRTNVLLLSTDFDHQSLFDLSCWSGLQTVVSGLETDVFVLTLASRRPPVFNRPGVPALYGWLGLWMSLWRDLGVKSLCIPIFMVLYNTPQ